MANETDAVGVTVEEAAGQIEDAIEADIDAPDEDQDDEESEELGVVDEMGGGDDDDSEDDAEEESAEEEIGDDDDQSRLYRVKVAGEELDVTLPELISGYSRSVDYVRKTQEVAELRRTATAHEEQAFRASEAYAQRLEIVGNALAGVLPPDKLEALHKEYQDVRDAQAAHLAEQRAAHLETEAKRLLEALPEWKDAERSSEEKRALVEYAADLGFSADDLAGIEDHRAMLILRKAMLYDRMQSESAGRGEKRRSIQRAAERLKKSGRASDAAAYLLEAMPDDF
jgi:hypothetical protein